MKVLAGLGNPGRVYERSRHNLGFRVMDCVASAWGVSWKEKYSWNSLVGRCDDFAEPVVMVKPLTFMNNSGRAIREVISYHRLGPQDLVVVADDVSLPLGTLRIRAHGSAGGHNGLVSVIEELGTKDFCRLRMGVGIGDISGADLTPFVLGAFGRGEEKAVQSLLEQAREALEAILKEGIPKAMTRFNRTSLDPCHSEAKPKNLKSKILRPSGSG